MPLGRVPSGFAKRVGKVYPVRGWFFRASDGHRDDMHMAKSGSFSRKSPFTFGHRPTEPSSCIKQLEGFKIDRYLPGCTIMLRTNRTESAIRHFAKHARHFLIGTSRSAGPNVA